ncbi:EthD domain-containing protein [Novosphingobium sp. BL-8A]|uniref:EthD domain-containing protein n=1 Tax=Novosphingobium sp. BL-8A TaxID=3127639 RepID=UPI0037583809
MIRTLCLLAHRPDRDRAFFQRYYEERHAPLAARLFPFVGYARNHVEQGEAFDWDTISEFMVDDPLGPVRVMEGPHAAIVRADEENFLDHARLVPARVEAHLFSAGPVTDGEERRLAVLIEGERDRAMTWAEALARDRAGVSLDVIVGRDAAFPADAVFWLSGHDDPGPVPPGLVAKALRMRRYETDMVAVKHDLENEGLQ